MSIRVRKQANEFRNFRRCVDYKDLVQFTVYPKLVAALKGNQFGQFRNEKQFVSMAFMAG